MGFVPQGLFAFKEKQTFANANQAYGNANGSSTSYTETQVTATDKLTLNAGRDMNLIGAQARGETVEADVGRNFTITSLQDTWV
ncbi:hemagglutinin repeat-containing protein [Formosimonas limnophila]|uniref:hemagglutinin repeat-containing protein n=1 Tax=Formosimonas limnophila TaxID=1384487 RepID=UPI00402BB099